MNNTTNGAQAIKVGDRVRFETNGRKVVGTVWSARCRMPDGPVWYEISAPRECGTYLRLAEEIELAQ